MLAGSGGSAGTVGTGGGPPGTLCGNVCEPDDQRHELRWVRLRMRERSDVLVWALHSGLAPSDGDWRSDGSHPPCRSVAALAGRVYLSGGTQRYVLAVSARPSATIDKRRMVKWTGAESESLCTRVVCFGEYRLCVRRPLRLLERSRHRPSPGGVRRCEGYMGGADRAGATRAPVQCSVGRAAGRRLPRFRRRWWHVLDDAFRGAI